MWVGGLATEAGHDACAHTVIDLSDVTVQAVMTAFISDSRAPHFFCLAPFRCCASQSLTAFLWALLTRWLSSCF